MKKTTTLLILFLAFIIFSAIASGSSSFPPEISAAIETKFKGMKLMGADDMDKNECDMIKGANGLLCADFNGDGVDDFAVLLRSKNSHRRENGDLYRYQVVAFISGKDKKHEPKVLTENEDFYPPITFVTIRKPGKVREFETGKTTAIKNPAIDLTYCGKSAVTYLWKGKKFSEIWTSD